ncbi:MAG: polyprenyl synthetase family protein [Candidatus Micrarchaeota archaeon]
MDFYGTVKEEMTDIERQIESSLKGKDEKIYGPLMPFIRRGGKRIRPLLSLLCFRAFSGKEYEQLKRTAAIIEMFHNFTLIHDDIEDDSKFRRGEPTLHISHGIAMALNSGDALYTLIWHELSALKMEPAKLVEVMKMCSGGFTEVVDGQGIEIYWERNNQFNISEADYYNMIEKKTAALIGLSCRIGAYLAGATEKEQDEVESYGRKIGIAFQIYDDVLNVSGNFEKYKKEIGGDITEGKRTLMVIKTLASASKQEAEQLKKTLSSHSDRKEDIDRIIALMKKYDAIEFASDKAKELVAAAKEDVKLLKPSKYKDALVAVADFVITREG